MQVTFETKLLFLKWKSRKTNVPKNSQGREKKKKWWVFLFLSLFVLVCFFCFLFCFVF